MEAVRYHKYFDLPTQIPTHAFKEEFHILFPECSITEVIELPDCHRVEADVPARRGIEVELDIFFETFLLLRDVKPLH